MMEQSSAAEESCVPPGFRFHPTEEELVGYYLARKVAASHHKTMDLIDIIQEVDLYRIEPWDLQERCRAGGEQTAAEWYFFSYKDRKYPSGTRTSRATAAGFWKATGRDKPVLSSSSCRVIGMRKTLVFYKGRAPNGSKTHWIMHEYRLLQTNDHHAHAQEEGWVVCRAFQKPIPNQRPCSFFPSYGATPAGGYHEHEHLPPPPPNARLHVLADGAHHHHYFLHPAAGHAANGSSRSFPPPQLYSDNDESKAKQQRRLLLSTSLPQLESPTSAAIACAGAAAQQQGSSYYSAGAAENELIQQGDRGGGQAAAAAGGGVGGAAIDYYWSFLDTLLSTTSQLDPRALI